MFYFTTFFVILLSSTYSPFSLLIAKVTISSIKFNRFITEQVSYLYRFSLKRNFESIYGMPPSRIDPLPWVISWICVISIILFLIYWIFAWGVVNGGTTLNGWGLEYSVAMIQDIFICETLKLCIMCVFAVISAKPQLQVIKRVINDCALSLIQDGNSYSSDVNITQSLSPSCRAAHMDTLSHLPASAVLRYVRYFNYHHYSHSPFDDPLNKI